MLSSSYAATTVGAFSLIAFSAFEALAVTTVMPTVARELDGVGLYALAFAAPLASGVIGMVAAGIWSDRLGPARPVVASLFVFSIGVLICGLAPAMELLIVGRVVQGLGTGAMVVALYVLVGEVFPAKLQPAVFASFAAAWVLPALFGPALAAWIAHVAGWRWVFISVVGFVVLAGVLITPSLRGLEPTTDRTRTDDSTGRIGRVNGQDKAGRRLGWAVAGASAVLLLELVGVTTTLRTLVALAAFGVVLWSLKKLTPPGTLRAAAGLPAAISTRAMLSGSFFCAEAYVVFVLQEQWNWTPGHAGLALTGVGVVWASSSQAQAVLGKKVSHSRAMQVGTTVVAFGILVLALTVWWNGSPFVVVAAYVVAGAGMGFSYPRTSVAMLDASTDADRGFNSSALNMADSMGAALALSISGIVFGSAHQIGGDRFVAVFVLAVGLAVLGAIAARRTEPGTVPASPTLPQ